MSPQLDAFVSVPIKLAARIRGYERERQCRSSPMPQRSRGRLSVSQTQAPSSRLLARTLLLAVMLAHQVSASASVKMEPILEPHSSLSAEHNIRHQAHYLSFVPSAHFHYHEGRQFGARSLEPTGADDQSATHGAIRQQHIYKRSSAANIGSGQQLAGSLWPQARHHQVSGGSSSSVWQTAHVPRSLHVSRRIMQSQQPPEDPLVMSASEQQPFVVAPGAQQQQASAEESERHRGHGHSAASHQWSVSGQSEQAEDGGVVDTSSAAEPGEDLVLLRQKQHIQYHDQWPALAGKCHKRTLNFCASVLPFNTTTFPNIIGDKNRFEVKRSLPFFGFLAKSACNRRLDQLLCLLLEPPCQPASGRALPPCKKFCRLALEGCNEYIPATLALSSVFDCRQYPDSNDGQVCVNLAQGSQCAADEFKCPDKTCIPRNWLCDGVRDCIFAADEANCTTASNIAPASVCSTEEFKCDGKCVPKAWRCDGERDCQDGSDEEACDLKPKCASDRFRCNDGNGCIPKRWVCDGKAECRDGSDEMNCNQRECSPTDFKCDNGICIPKLWRCDGQADCRDGSDERSCIFTKAANRTSGQPTPESSQPEGLVESTGAPAGGSEEQENTQVNMTSYTLVGQQQDESVMRHLLANSGPAATGLYAAEQQEQLESNLSGDVSRIIQREQQQASQTTTSSHSVQTTMTPTITTSTTAGSSTTSPPTSISTTLAPPEVSSESVPKEELSPALGEHVAPPAGVIQQHQPDVQLMQQQQQQTRPLVNQVAHRVPIYKSLFKSLKANQQPQVVMVPVPLKPFQEQQQQQMVAIGQAPNSLRRNIVAVARRRRDRQHQHHQQAALVRQQQQQQQQPLAPAQFVQFANQTRVGPLAAASQQNYLQLFNGRYNLRLSRL